MVPVRSCVCVHRLIVSDNFQVSELLMSDMKVNTWCVLFKEIVSFPVDLLLLFEYSEMIDV